MFRARSWTNGMRCMFRYILMPKYVIIYVKETLNIRNALGMHFGESNSNALRGIWSEFSINIFMLCAESRSVKQQYVGKFHGIIDPH